MGYGIFTGGGSEGKQLGEIVISTLDLSGTEYLKIPTDSSFKLLSANEIGADPWFYATLESYPYEVNNRTEWPIEKDNIQSCNYYQSIGNIDDITENEFSLLFQRYSLCSRIHKNFYTRYFPGVGKIISLDNDPFDSNSETVKNDGRALCLVDETEKQTYFFRTKDISVKNNNVNFIPWYCQKFNNNFYLNNPDPMSGYLITGQVLYDSVANSQYSISYFINTSNNKIYPIKLITAQTGTAPTNSEKDSHLHMIKSIAFNGSYLGILYNARPGIASSTYNRMSCMKNENKIFFEEIDNSYYQLKLTKENKTDEYPKLCTAATRSHNFILPTEEEEKFILLAINSNMNEFADMPNFENPQKYASSTLSNSDTKYLTGIDVTTNTLYDINASIPVPDSNKTYYYYTLFDPTLDKLVVRPAFQNSSTGIYKGYIYENLSKSSRSKTEVKFVIPQATTSSNNEVYDMKNDILFYFEQKDDKIQMNFMDRKRSGEPRETVYTIFNNTNIIFNSKNLPCQINDLNQYLNTFGKIWTIEETIGYSNSVIEWKPGYVLPTFSLNDDSRGKLNAFIKIK